MLRRALVRLFRLTIPVALAVVAWVAWWVYAQRPIKSYCVTTPAYSGGSWSHPVMGSELVALATSGRKPEDSRSLLVDLAAAQAHNLNSEHRLSFFHWPDDLSCLLLADKDGSFRVADVPSIKTRFRIPPMASGIQKMGDYNLSFAPEGGLLAIGFRSGKSHDVWNLKTGKRQLQLEGVEGQIALGCNGKHAAAQLAGTSGVGVWDVHTGNRIAELPDYGEQLQCLTFLPNGNLIVGYAPRDETNKTPPAAAVAAGGGMVVMSRSMMSGPTTAALSIWNPTTNHKQTVGTVTFSHPSMGYFRRVDTSEDGRYIGFDWATSGSIWDLAATPPVCLDESLKFTGKNRFVSFDSKAHRFATTSQTEVKLYDHATTNPVSLEDFDLGKQGSMMRFSPDGRWLTVTTGEDIDWSKWKWRLRQWLNDFIPGPSTEHVALFNAESGKLVHELPATGIAAWTADGKQVWTRRDPTVVGGHRSGTGAPQWLYELWPIHRPRPPWWLWAITFVLAVLFLREIRNCFARRIVTQPA